MNNNSQKTLIKNSEVKKTESVPAIDNLNNTKDFSMLVSIKDRIEKITTALYMLTDLLDKNESLRHSMREKSVASLGLINSYFIDNNYAAQNTSKLYYLLSEIKSYLDVGYYNRFFSEMNYSVINSEIMNLMNTFSSFSEKNNDIQNKEEINALFIEKKLFQIKEPIQKNNPSYFKESAITNDTSKKEPEIKKEVVKDNPVFVERKSDLTKSYAASFLKKTQPVKRKKVVHRPKVNEAKEERKKTILNVLEKKNNSSINDICELFKDCSSKTIQRDLNELIEQGLVSKQGSRRWSTYNLV